MDTSTIVDILQVITGYFHKKDIPYVIVGGISVLTWGRIRTTEDIDIIVDHTQLNIEDFTRYLKNHEFFAEVEDFQGFSEEGHCSILKKGSLFRLDFVGKYSIDKEISLNEAKEVEYQGLTLLMDSPENLIAHKLKFAADFDIEDAIAVLIRVNKRIDIEKLLRHVERLKVKNQLFDIIRRIKETDENALATNILKLLENDS